MTRALTTSLQERLKLQAAADDMPARLEALVRRLRDYYDRRTVPRTEWDQASGDDV